MPRTGWVKPVSDRRMSDLVSVGLLTRVFPSDLVDEVIAAAGRTEQRKRTLPARVMAYFAIGMALYSDGSYEEVMAQLTDGLSWSTQWAESWEAPSKSAIFQARARLGADPLRELFSRVAVPLIPEDTEGPFLAHLRIVAIDGTCIDVADTVENSDYFGRPGVSKGERSAFPQARIVALTECGSHAIFEAVVGSYSIGEIELSRELVTKLKPGMLLLADRGFYGFRLWTQAAATGADLAWRVGSSLKPRYLETLADGSWLAEVRPSGNEGRKALPAVVRVIDYAIEDGRNNQESYRLLTTILDPTVASAKDLALAYAKRWEIESVFDELKTHQRGPRMVLRSKSPELVEQEIWGYLCCHYAIRTLMWEAAAHGNKEPERVSFISALRVARRSLAQQGAFPPSRP